MNRRGFLKALGCLAAAPVLCKLVPAALEAETPAVTTFTTYLVGRDAIVSGPVITASMIRDSVASLRAANIKPYQGNFIGYVYPDYQG